VCSPAVGTVGEGGNRPAAAIDMEADSNGADRERGGKGD
jgi:hypothetical protein